MKEIKINSFIMTASAIHNAMYQQSVSILIYLRCQHWHQWSVMMMILNQRKSIFQCNLNLTIISKLNRKNGGQV